MADKRRILNGLLEALDAEAAARLAAASATYEGATHEEVPPESDEDTRALDLITEVS